MKKSRDFLFTGIKGLDEICRGGFIRGSSILVTGIPGSGKSIFALQFAIGGAIKGESSLIVLTEETADSMRKNAESLGMDLINYEKKGLIMILEQKISGSKIISMQAPMDIIKKKKIKRVILDSLSVFSYIYKEGSDEYKKGLLQFIWNMKSIDGITFLAVTERHSTSLDEFQYKQDDSLFDGIIFLTKIRKGASFERCLHVAKLRGQNHGFDIYPFNIGKGGISVYPKELPFSLMENG